MEPLDETGQLQTEPRISRFDPIDPPRELEHLVPRHMRFREVGHGPDDIYLGNRPIVGTSAASVRWSTKRLGTTPG